MKPRQLLEKTTTTFGENHGNQNPHLIQLIWKPGNGWCVVTGSQSSVLGSGWTVHRIIKRIKNRYYIKTEQAGLTFRGNSSIPGAGAQISAQSLPYLGANFGISA